MEEALGAALLVRGRQGVTPTQAGRTLLQHARAILRQAERLREDLGAYAGGLAGQIRVLSNTNALTEFLPEALSSFLSDASQCQRRSRGTAERRDRGPDRRRGCRSRHRRRHRRCKHAGNLSLSQGSVRAGGRTQSSAREALEDFFRGGAGPRLRRSRPRQRAPAFPRGQSRAHRTAAAAARAAAQLRCRMPPGRVQCRDRHRAGDHRAPRGARPWRSFRWR